MSSSKSARMPNALLADSTGAETIGLAQEGEIDATEVFSGVHGEIVSVTLAVCRATRVTPNAALPAVDNIFEYLVMLQDREGEEWVMGSVSSAPVA